MSASQRLSDADLAAIGELDGTPGDSLHVALARELQELRVALRGLVGMPDVVTLLGPYATAHLRALLPEEAQE